MTTRAPLIAALLLASSLAHAQPPDTVEAGKRFSAGVALYNEADYRAALVEFKRAYDIAPSAVVLYNIGQTQYQLQDYASAYVTLSRFLAESDKKADHRAEVEQTIALLQARIGKIAISTDEPGAEVFVDDDLVGKTPLAQPVLVSVGKRKVAVRQPGKQAWERTIEVAAGDVVRQDVTLQSLTITRTEENKPFPYAKVGWITTGVLAAGAITFGVLAYTGQNKLDDMRNEFGITRGELTDQADKVGVYSGLADGIGLAAIAVGASTLIYVLTRDDNASPEKKTQVGIGPGGIIVGGTF